MSHESGSGPPRSRGLQWWNEAVVPSACGLKNFIWNVAWFLVFLCWMFSYSPFTQGGRHEDRASSVVGYQTLREEPTA
jgi:hypothetical protein